MEIIQEHQLKKKKTLPLNGDKSISFNYLEIISRSNKKLIHIKDIKKIPKKLQKKIKKDLKLITKKKKF